jgi:hypothetical protein
VLSHTKTLDRMSFLIPFAADMAFKALGLAGHPRGPTDVVHSGTSTARGRAPAAKRRAAAGGRKKGRAKKKRR